MLYRFVDRDSLVGVLFGIHLYRVQASESAFDVPAFCVSKMCTIVTHQVSVLRWCKLRPCLVLKKFSTVLVTSNVRTYAWSIKCS